MSHTAWLLLRPIILSEALRVLPPNSTIVLVSNIFNTHFNESHFVLLRDTVCRVLIF